MRLRRRWPFGRFRHETVGRRHLRRGEQLVPERARSKPRWSPPPSQPPTVLSFAPWNADPVPIVQPAMSPATPNPPFNRPPRRPVPRRPPHNRGRMG
jgi:hypothetical protein